jgi:DegV family protein with EDD domain
VSVIVVTDSSACLAPEVAEELGIRIVPLHVLVEDVELREGVDEIPRDLAGAAVTTSAASPGEMRVAYTRALAESDGDGVVGVHISRQLSGTWEAGRQALDELGGKVRIVDSLGAGLGSGFPALAAARMARTGAGLDDVYRAAVDVAARSRCYIVVDRIEQLRRGGRISTAALVFGTALVTKPLLQIVDGKLVLKEKARTSSKVFVKLVDAAVKAAGDGEVAVAVQHLDAVDRADEVVAELRKRIPKISELVVSEFGPTLGVHLGPGAVGVVVVPGGAGL